MEPTVYTLTGHPLFALAARMDPGTAPTEDELKYHATTC